MGLSLGQMDARDIVNLHIGTLKTEVAFALG